MTWRSIERDARVLRDKSMLEGCEVQCRSHLDGHALGYIEHSLYPASSPSNVCPLTLPGPPQHHYFNTQDSFSLSQSWSCLELNRATNGCATEDCMHKMRDHQYHRRPSRLRTFQRHRSDASHLDHWIYKPTQNHFHQFRNPKGQLHSRTNRCQNHCRCRQRVLHFDQPFCGWQRYSCGFY
jgi:hypothetical protein